MSPTIRSTGSSALMLRAALRRGVHTCPVTTKRRNISRPCAILPQLATQLNDPLFAGPRDESRRKKEEERP